VFGQARIALTCAMPLPKATTAQRIRLFGESAARRAGNCEARAPMEARADVFRAERRERFMGEVAFCPCRICACERCPKPHGVWGCVAEGLAIPRLTGLLEGCLCAL
jgi:hypothetical protein